MSLHECLLTLVQQCSDAVMAIAPRGGAFDFPSQKTRAEYLHLANTLLQRVGYANHSLRDVTTDTTSPRTFQKRLAALRYCLHVRQRELMEGLHQASDEQLLAIQPELEQHLQRLLAFAAIQRTGLQGGRKKRQSKRKALTGLPDDWREAICERSEAGKYRAALLTAALSGCRPAELQTGVYIWRAYDETLQAEAISIDIAGAKVKARQGQPRRIISYATSDPHPLVVAMNRLLDQQDEPALHVQITSAGNFTVEIRRLAKCLWPTHPHAITAYCLRHQWSADAKRTQPADSVSQGLGHASAKTRRNYGQAQQARHSGALCPLAISAERSIRPLPTQPPTPNRPISVPRPGIH